MNRQQKKDFVAAMKDSLNEAVSAVVIHYRGLSVAEITELRNKARENGTTVKVTKNSLTKIAANDTKFAGLAEYLSGPTAIAYSQDAVAAAKTVVDFAKDNEKLEILGGALDEKILDASGVKQLASMPSLDESRAKIIGLINAPASKLASVVQAPAGQLARVFSAYGNTGA
ncbi:MAG: 50S ribosomal protein L10 [Hyphomicrobiales bacterium]|nr:50S ribosomal protein L10 [Hyphomicrobiales bacterium]